MLPVVVMDLGTIPLDAVRSDAEYVILDADLNVVSEHADAQAASRAFAQHILKTGEDSGLILCRTVAGWVEF